MQSGNCSCSNATHKSEWSGNRLELFNFALHGGSLDSGMSGEFHYNTLHCTFS